MKKLLIALLISAPAFAGTAFLKYERVSGMNKICYYDHMGSTVAITVGALEFCPAVINV